MKRFIKSSVVKKANVGNLFSNKMKKDVNNYLKLALFENDKKSIFNAFNAIFDYFSKNKNNIKDVIIDNDYGVVIDNDGNEHDLMTIVEQSLQQE